MLITELCVRTFILQTEFQSTYVFTKRTYLHFTLTQLYINVICFVTFSALVLLSSSFIYLNLSSVLSYFIYSPFNLIFLHFSSSPLRYSENNSLPCLFILWEKFFSHVHFRKYSTEKHVNKTHRRNLRSSGILRNAQWQFFTDVSGQPIGPIFKGQRSRIYFSYWIS